MSNMKRPIALLLLLSSLGWALTGCNGKAPAESSTLLPTTQTGETVPVQTTVPETTVSETTDASEISALLAAAEARAAELEYKLMNDPSLTQADMNCLSYDIYTLWDDLLNDLWARLKETLPEEEMAQLTQEELAWIGTKEAAAKEAAAEYEGGSLAPLAAGQSQANLTRERVYELARLLTGEDTVRLDNCSALYEHVFLSACLGYGTNTVGLPLDVLKDELDARGYSYIEETVDTLVILVPDPEKEGSYLRGSVSGSGADAEITTLHYCLSLNGTERRVEARNLGYGKTPELYIGITPYSAGTQVASVEEMTEFLNSPMVPEEPAAATGIQSNLFQSIFLPTADGRLDRDTENFKTALTENGFLIHEGEGELDVYDPENPGSYLYALPTYEAENNVLACLGYCLAAEAGQRGVRVDFHDGAPKYFIQTGLWDTETQVQSLEEMVEYLKADTP